MTSGQNQTTGKRGPHAALGLILGLVLGLAPGAGCQVTPPRETLTTPHHPPRVWAVAPLLNESGVSVVDTAAVADMIAQEVQAVEGLDALPVNRVLTAMRRLGVASVQTGDDARVLLDLLGADALIVGTITAWDPYPPLRMGLALQVHGRRGPTAVIDPVRISRTTAGEVPPGGPVGDIEPLATAARVFDARDHETLTWLEQYAASRHVPDSAYGPDVFLVSLDLFTQFAAHRLLRDLLWQGQMGGVRVAAE